MDAVLLTAIEMDIYGQHYVIVHKRRLLAFLSVPSLTFSVTKLKQVLHYFQIELYRPVTVDIHWRKCNRQGNYSTQNRRCKPDNPPSFKPDILLQAFAAYFFCI